MENYKVKYTEIRKDTGPPEIFEQFFKAAIKCVGFLLTAVEKLKIKEKNHKQR